MRRQPARHTLSLLALAAALTAMVSSVQAEDDEGDGNSLAERPKQRSTTRHPADPFDAPRETAAARGPGASDSPDLDAARDLLRWRADLQGVMAPGRTAAGGLPVVRGLSGNRVLLMLDGIRLNHAITRADSDTLLAAVDPLQVAALDVLHGPGAVAFGSGALGGAIDLRTRRPSFDPRRAWDLAAEGLARYGSAGHGLIGHAAASGHLRRIGLRAAGTLRRLGDVGAGRGGAPQPYSGFWGGAARADAVWAISEASALELGYSTVAVLDAPRPGRSSARDFSLTSDQRRDLVALRYHAEPGGRLLDRLEATVSYQLHREQRQRFRLDEDRVEREEDSVGVLGSSLVLRSRLPYNSLSYGLDLYHDRVGSSAEQESISSRTVSQSDRGRYHDGSHLTRFGAFALDRLTLGKLALDLGGRVSAWHAHVAAPADERLSKSDWIASGSLHGRYLFGDGLSLVAGVAQGFRSPNIDDYSARGCGLDRYDVPNEDLGAERSVTAEAGVKLDLFGLLRGSVFYHYSHLDNLIIARPATIDAGAGPVSTFTCGTDVGGRPRVVPILRRENATGGVHGVEGKLQLDVGRWALFGWVAWARGEVTVAQPAGGEEFGEPLDGVPPLTGLAGLRYAAVDGRWFAQLGVRWAARQDRLGPGDRALCSPAEGQTCRGTAGFAAVDLRGGARIHEALRLTLTINNLTDERYRFHRATLDAAGLSAVIGLEASVR